MYVTRCSQGIRCVLISSADKEYIGITLMSIIRVVTMYASPIGINRLLESVSLASMVWFHYSLAYTVIWRTEDKEPQSNPSYGFHGYSSGL